MIYSVDIKNRYDCDIAVIGGGFSGFAAAYSAAREGMKVILVEGNGAIGGVGTGGLVNHILGVRAFEGDNYRTCVKGIFSEIERRLVERGKAVDVKTVDHTLPPHGWKRSLGIGLVFDNEEMKLLLEEMLSEVGVRVMYYTRFLDAVKKEGRIESAVIHNKSGFSLLCAKSFVDATGDGDLCSLCGEKMNFGDEEGGVAAASLEMHVENVDHVVLREYMAATGDVRFKAIIERLRQQGIWNFPYDIFISVMMNSSDVFMINTIRQVGIDGTDGESLTRGTIEGRAENYKLLEIMRAHFPGFKNARIRQIAPNIGIRETRRLEARYNLSVKDLVEGRRFEDSIAVSGYGWDLPDPKRPSLQKYHDTVKKARFTEIPYSSLLPRKTENLIAVGRCIGCEREVLGVVRVMGPCIAMGEAAGIAAAIAPNGAYGSVDVKALKQKIKEYGGVTDADQI